MKTGANHLLHRVVLQAFLREETTDHPCDLGMCFEPMPGEQSSGCLQPDRPHNKSLAYL